MNRNPRMVGELFDSIENLFSNDEEIMADVYVYLANLPFDLNEVQYLSQQAMIKLDKMDRCTRCGDKLRFLEIKEPHPELDGCPVEILTDAYCENCGG